MAQDDWKTLRVPPEAYNTAKAQKEEAGRTWGEQLVAPVEPDFDRESLAERLDRIESAAKEATSAAHRAENAVDKLAEGRR